MAFERFGSVEKSPPQTEFPLPGFFDNAKLIPMEVGTQVFKYPSIEDVKFWSEHTSPGMLKRMDKEQETDYKMSTENVIHWIELGVKHLETASEYIKASQKALSDFSIEDARSAFENAQQVSKKMNERYFPTQPETRSLL